MKEFNASVLFGTPGRPALPKPFYWISGYGLWNKWNVEDIGLATLSGIAGMPGEDDGMVAEYSSQAVGKKFFRTEANHHHNRRNDFDKKIGTRLAGTLSAREQSQESRDWTKKNNIILPEYLQDRAGNPVRFCGPLMSNREEERSSKYRSTRYVRIVKLAGTSSLPVYLDDSSQAYLALWPLDNDRNDYRIQLNTDRQPDMTVTNLHEKAGLARDVQNLKSLHIERPVAGEYTLTIEQNRSQSREYAMVVNTYGKLTMDYSLSSSNIFNHNKFALFAHLQCEKKPVIGAQVKVSLSRHGSEQKQDVVLHDDGKNGDNKANDGIYTARMKAGRDITETGTWFARFYAEGQMPDSGQSF